MEEGRRVFEEVFITSLYILVNQLIPMSDVITGIRLKLKVSKLTNIRDP